MGSEQPNDVSLFNASDEQPIWLTASAIKAVKEAISQEGQAGDGLRVSIVGGGCAGYQYGLDFEKDPRLDDTVMDFDGIRVFIDSISTSHLKGTVIDYVSGLQGAGFKFKNPNARRTCGCGNSFG